MDKYLSILFIFISSLFYVAFTFEPDSIFKKFKKIRSWAWTITLSKWLIFMAPLVLLELFFVLHGFWMFIFTDIYYNLIQINVYPLYFYYYYYYSNILLSKKSLQNYDCFHPYTFKYFYDIFYIILVNVHIQETVNFWGS